MVDQTLSAIWSEKDAVLLLDAVSQHAIDSTSCELRIRPDSAFVRTDGTVPIWFGLEYLTQAITVHSRLRAGRLNVPALELHFAGASNIEYLANSFTQGQSLEISVTLTKDKPPCEFYQGIVKDRSTQEILVSGLITVFQPHGVGSGTI